MYINRNTRPTHTEVKDNIGEVRYLACIINRDYHTMTWSSLIASIQVKSPQLNEETAVDFFIYFL